MNPWSKKGVLDRVFEKLDVIFLGFIVFVLIVDERRLAVQALVDAPAQLWPSSGRSKSLPRLKGGASPSNIRDNTSDYKA